MHYFLLGGLFEFDSNDKTLRVLFTNFKNLKLILRLRCNLNQENTLIF